MNFVILPSVMESVVPSVGGLVMDRNLIEIYAQGAPTVREALAGLSAEDVNAFPVPGTWSIRQIVVHLMESDLIASDRMKRIACMPHPLLMGYDESAFAELPGVHDLDLSLVCDVFEKNRLLTADILRHLPSETYQRFGIHSESGKVTLEYMVKAYIDHLDHHMIFLRKKREILLG